MYYLENAVVRRNVDSQKEEEKNEADENNYEESIDDEDDANDENSSDKVNDDQNQNKKNDVTDDTKNEESMDYENNPKEETENISGDDATSVPEIPEILPAIQIAPKKERKRFLTEEKYTKLVNTFKLAGIPYFDKLVGIIDVIKAWSSGPKKSIWDQIKGKVLSSQRSGITDYHIQ